MNSQRQVSINRKGQFLWKEPEAQQTYLQIIRKRIADGYYFSDTIFSKVVDEIAPVLEDITSRE